MERRKKVFAKLQKIQKIFFWKIHDIFLLPLLSMAQRQIFPIFLLQISLFFQKDSLNSNYCRNIFSRFFCVTQKKRAKKDSNLYAKISFYTKMLFFCEAFFRWFSYGKFYHLYSLLLFFVIGIFFLSLFSVFIYWRCESVFVKILVFLMELIGLKVDVQFI